MTEPLIHPTALPNDLSPDRLRLRPAANGSVAVDAGIAGWRYLAFRTVMLASGGLLIRPARGRKKPKREE